MKKKSIINCSMLIIHCSLLIALLIGCSSKETVFYVSPDGNDSWSGTKSEPFKTITYARDAIRKLKKSNGKIEKSATVYLRGGTYELTEPIEFAAVDGGTAEFPVTYKAYKNEKPVISGGRRITNLQKVDSNLWQAVIPEVKNGEWYSRNLFVNGERRFRARTPNEGYLRIDSVLDVPKNSPYNAPCHRFVYRKGDFRANMRNPKDIEAVVLHFWVDTHLNVDSIDNAKNIVNFSKSSCRKLTDDFNTIPARYYIDNTYEGMDYPGEWYLDRKTGMLNYLAKENEDMKNSEIVLGRLPRLIQFNSSLKKDSVIQYINFEGLTFAYSNWELAAKDAGDLQAAVTVEGAIRGSVKHMKMTKCTVRNLGNYAIDLTDGSTDNLIANNEIYDCGGGGIRINGGDAKSDKLLLTGHNNITDNHIHHIGQIYHSAVGILSQHASYNLIAHNHIHHTYYTAISVGWVWGYSPSVSSNNHIEYNDLHHIGQGILSDMGGVYMLGIAPGTTVNHNLIHHVRSYGYGGWGIYTDEGSTDVMIENNVVYFTKSSGFHQHYGKNNIIRNNIFAMNTDAQIQRTRNEKHLSFTFEKNIVYWAESPFLSSNWRENNYKFDKNIYFRTDGLPIMFSNYTPSEWHKKGQDLNSLIGVDPQFTDPNKFDFSLKASSPAFKLGFVKIDLAGVGVRDNMNK